MASATSLCVALACFGRPAAAAPPDEGEEVAESPDPDPAERAAMEAAGATFVEGQLAFDNKDFDAAISAWTRALDLVPPGMTHDASRNNIRLSIAAAYLERYDVAHDITDLRKADRLVLDVLDDLPGDEPTVRASVAAEHRRVRAALEEAEREEQARQAEEREAARAGRRDAAREREAKSLEQQRLEKENGARIMIIAGSATAVVGAGFLGAMAVSLISGRNAERSGSIAARDPAVSEDELRQIAGAGEKANANATATGVVAGILLVPAAALIGVGIRNRREAAAPTVSPTASQYGAGIVIGGRF